MPSPSPSETKTGLESALAIELSAEGVARRRAKYAAMIARVGEMHRAFALPLDVVNYRLGSIIRDADRREVAVFKGDGHEQRSAAAVKAINQFDRVHHTARALLASVRS